MLKFYRDLLGFELTYIGIAQGNSGHIIRMAHWKCIPMYWA
ncbi:hypothetical protein [Chitinophaga sp. MM2321]